MRASEKFRVYTNSPVAHMCYYFTEVLLNDLETKKISDFVIEIKTGRTPPSKSEEFYTNGVIPWYKPDEIGFGIFLEASNNYLSQIAIDGKKATIYSPGTILMTCIGDVGRIGILSTEASSNQQITGIKFNNNVLPEYAYFYMLCRKLLFEQDSSSTTLPILNQKKLLNIEFRCPQLCLQLEFVKFAKYCLECFDKGDSPSNFNYNLDSKLFSFCRKVFNVHFLREKQSKYLKESLNLICNLRKSISKEAVQGKLVPQDLDDEPASALLEKIKAEKEQLIKDKKIKKEKPLSEITENEIPYDLPNGWEWGRLGDICSIITDGTHQTPNYAENGMMFLSAQNIKPYKFMPEKHRFVSNEDYLNYTKNVKPVINDILITRVGAGIGEAAIIDQDIDFAIYVSLGLIKPIHKFINSKYILHWLNSPDGTTNSKENTLGRGTSQGNLNLSLIRNFCVSIPPLDEQKRIVENIDLLMALCDELEKTIEQSKQESEMLMHAVLQEAFQST